ncbi:hypothetical protein Pmar_PMAR025589 [Perkinsus marinus ATCC 50983]|uniref:Uncharacterized protein n=1 Tax=Perkinsus marinus (strain ATCC 50983 / TXsc) TaxID=423536 RepID=C5LZG8_PERM5|nr:hypothetical protein Pmar_PMAR025589 [Perkinsus marinus ATCC 50983]EEQ97962.1 hypothetical protein Pmar_PMAR025589 [Perkinsus marinus ATCC 50983]|eukprot:XP_002765245.1 hypothetical protein Pmar_PMAR025589 [Perkinsus marinus ATCC 50983]
MTMKTDETAVGFLGRVKERGLAVNQDHTVTAAEYRQRLIFGLPRWLKRRLEGFYGPRLHSTSADDLADTADYFRVTELQEKETQYDRAPDRARGLKGVYEPSQTSQRGEAQKIRACHRCGSLVHLKADCQVPADVKCSNCGRTGHAMAACRDVRCRRCNKKGHLAKNCQKGDSRSQNGAKAVQSNQATQEGKKETSQGPTASQGLVEVHIAAAVAQETPGTMKIHSIGERDSPPLLKCDLGDTGICVQEVLLDSGAACSLIPRQIVEDLKKLGGVKVLATPRAIKLIYADGSTALSKEEAIVPVRLREHSDKLAYIPFVIVDCPLPRVIFGRRALCILDVNLKFHETDPCSEQSELRRTFLSEDEDRHPSSRRSNLTAESVVPAIHVEVCRVNGELLVSTPEEEYSDAKESDLLTSHPLPGGWVEKLLEKAMPKGVRQTSLRGRDAKGKMMKKATLCLDAIAAQGWVEIGNGFKGRLAKGDQIMGTDTESQKYQYQVRWTVTPATNENATYPWSSTKMIQSLTPTQKEEWDNQLDGYIKKGWWKPQLRPPDQDQMRMAATVFPVIQSEAKTTKIRPCVDLRRINGVSPPLKYREKTSVGPSSVPEAIQQLRAMVDDRNLSQEIRQYDLAKAFYSIRVLPVDEDGHPLEIWLKAGMKWFSSSCLVFGLSCGPLGLNFSQLTLLKCAEKISSALGDDAARWICVMDDYIAVGNRQDVVDSEIVMELLWNLCGFSCPPDKRSCYWKFAQATGLAMKRPAPATEMQTPITKREVYKAAGSFLRLTHGYEEALAIGHADAMRKLAGAWKDWDIPPEDKATVHRVREHFKLAKLHWDRCSPSDQRLISYQHVEKLRVEVDASQEGHGFCAIGGPEDAEIQDNSDNIIYAEARFFSTKSRPLDTSASRSERSAHNN